MIRILTILSILAPASAMAQAADAAAAPTGAQQFAGVLPLIAIAAVMYFLLIRPQAKRMKEHHAMLGALKKGDEVVTGGGIVGKVTKVEEGNDTVTVEIAPSIEVRVVKSTIGSVLGKDAAKASVATSKKSAAEKSNKNDNVLPGKDRIANDN